MPTASDNPKRAIITIQAAFIAYVKNIYDGNDPVRIAEVLEEIRRAVYPPDATIAEHHRQPKDEDAQAYLKALFSGDSLYNGFRIDRERMTYYINQKSPQLKVKLARFLSDYQKNLDAQAATNPAPQLPKPRRNSPGNDEPHQ
jgi:hypothetical protein